MNPRVVAAKYAVRGAIPARAAEHSKALRTKNNGLPFDKLLWCNIGNPQAVGMEPITFFRHAIAAAALPTTEGFPLPSDVVSRVNRMKQSFNVGAYTDSTGSEFIRTQITDFLKRRDGFEASPDSVMLSNGASESCALLFQTVVRGSQDEVLIPIPQYPLYSATITLSGATQKEYYLDEESGWSFDVDSVEVNEKTRIFVAINPGNPTGACLPEEAILAILRKIERDAPNCIVVADEVYQDNIWGDQPFVSFRKIAKENNIKVPLVTMHSTSKGLIGECGARGGFCQLEHFDERIVEEIFKLRSISLCPGTYGQMMMGLLVSPPKDGEDSFDLFRFEQNLLNVNFKRKAVKTRAFLNSLEGVSCSDVQGAMYAFPSLTLPSAFQEKANRDNIAADELYCRELLDHTGVVTVPGSGFGQKDGTWHLRTTILPAEDDLDIFFPKWEAFHKRVMEGVL